jgi:uncharacterized membrane protein
VARLIGVDDSGGTGSVIRLIGLREIGSGLGLLIQPKPTPWLWARAGGDAMDLLLLGRTLGSPGADRGRLLVATAAVLGIAGADALVSFRMAKEPDAPYEARQERPVHATAAVTIDAPAAEVYRWWDGFRQVPRFMRDAASVEITGDRTSRWTIAGPAGVTAAWDVELLESRPNEQISWRTGEDSTLTGAGEVRFRPAPRDQGTEVIFDARFEPPGGALGKSIGGVLAQALGFKLTGDLRRLKQLIEVGEVVQSDDSVIPGPNPAQPPQSVPSESRSAVTAA